MNLNLLDTDIWWETLHKNSFKNILHIEKVNDVGNTASRRIYTTNGIIHIKEILDETLYRTLRIFTDNNNNISVNSWAKQDIEYNIISFGLFNFDTVYYYPINTFKEAIEKNINQWSIILGAKKVKTNEYFIPVPLILFNQAIKQYKKTTLKETDI
jgi:hypothetical protein